MAERIRVVARAFPEAHREQQEALVVVSASECAASASSALDPEMTPPIAFVRKIAAFAAIATSTGAPAGERDAPPPAAPDTDPVPGETGGQTPPGLAGEPRPGRGTEPPGV